MAKSTSIGVGGTVKNYLSLVKFSHTIFAMPFALIGFCLALFKGQQNLNQSIGWGWDITNSVMWEFMISKFILVLLCMVFARSAAMAFNRYLDRQWDALNPRTAIREIPKGIITPKNALAFTITCCVLFYCLYLLYQYHLLCIIAGSACRSVRL